jgi:hypothetical protein
VIYLYFLSRMRRSTWIPRCAREARVRWAPSARCTSRAGCDPQMGCALWRIPRLVDRAGGDAGEAIYLYFVVAMSREHGILSLRQLWALLHSTMCVCHRSGPHRRDRHLSLRRSRFLGSTTVGCAVTLGAISHPNISPA